MSMKPGAIMQSAKLVGLRFGGRLAALRASTLLIIPSSTTITGSPIIDVGVHSDCAVKAIIENQNQGYNPATPTEKRKAQIGPLNAAGKEIERQPCTEHRVLPAIFHARRIGNHRPRYRWTLLRKR